MRCGGRQEKVAPDDVVIVDKLPGEAGSSVTFKAVLVVDGERVISDPAEVSRYQVTADIVGDAAGVIERDIEVHAHEDPVAFELQVLDGELGHLLTILAAEIAVFHSQLIRYFVSYATLSLTRPNPESRD